MPNSPHASVSPTIPEREHIRRTELRDLDASGTSAGGIGDYPYSTPRRELDRIRRRGAVVLDDASPLPGDGEAASGTPAPDAYLEARAQAGAVGVALADPEMRRALILDRLQRDHTRMASLLPEGYDATRRPAVWRVRARAEWQRHQKTARALEQNAEWQEQLRSELGPNSDSLTRQALALTDARDHILARTSELQRDAIEEELAREPEWLTHTLGPRPEHGAGSWQTLAGQLAANRMRFLVVDDADPGIRPEQSGLAQQVAQFQAAASLTQALEREPDIGFGM